MKKKPWIIGMTGASGVVYGVRLVQALLDLDFPVALVISDSARLVLKEEMGFTPHLRQASDLETIFGDRAAKQIELFSPKDFSAPIASGSYPTAGMVVIPCSMGSLGAIAGGLSGTLIHRAADCMIKEGRKLVLVPRETPFSAIHLENMLKLSRIGVKIVPAMPGFYAGAKRIEDLVDFMVGKVLDQLEISHCLYPRWVGLTKNESKHSSFPSA